MKITLYLTATTSASTELREVRSVTTHSLLCLAGDEGLLLYDRRSRAQHCLTWKDICALYKQVQDMQEQKTAPLIDAPAILHGTSN